MGHLMSSLKPGPDDEVIDKVGVGTVVEYHGRAGSMRQGRTSFPAMVLRQHPDDGSLDLLVFFEAEDILWEQRVLPWSEQKPDRCWTPVPHNPLHAELQALHEAIFGDFERPPKPIMEHLSDLDMRLRKLENPIKAKKGK